MAMLTERLRDFAEFLEAEGVTNRANDVREAIDRLAGVPEIPEDSDSHLKHTSGPWKDRDVDTSDEQCALVCMIVSNPGDGDRPRAWQKRVNDLIRALRDERNEMQRVFDLRWDADMRAVKRWQEAHPGNELVWPDHMDLLLWLLGRMPPSEPTKKMIEAARDAWLARIHRKIAGEQSWGDDDSFIETYKVMLSACPTIAKATA